MNQAAPAQRGRLQFLLLATLFFLPLVAASALYFWFPSERPAGTTNYGELVVPARPLPPLQLLDARGQPVPVEALRGRWTLVQIAGENCLTDCLERLVRTRQTRTILNEKRQRVQRVLLASDAVSAAALQAQLGSEHPDLHIFADTDAALFAFLAPQDPLAVYLLDPHGNWLMRYPSGRSVEDDFKGMQKDIKKLLRLSQIG